MPCNDAGLEAGDRVPESSSRANTGLSASLEAELRDLERHWEDLDRADALDAAQAQPAAQSMVSLHPTFWPSSELQNSDNGLHVLATCHKLELTITLWEQDLGFMVYPVQGGYDEDDELLAQKKVASVIERWESRSISADALQHMRERASAYAGHRGSSADGSATDEASGPQVHLTGISNGPT